MTVIFRKKREREKEKKKKKVVAWSINNLFFLAYQQSFYFGRKRIKLTKYGRNDKQCHNANQPMSITAYTYKLIQQLKMRETTDLLLFLS